MFDDRMLGSFSDRIPISSPFLIGVIVNNGSYFDEEWKYKMYRGKVLVEFYCDDPPPPDNGNQQAGGGQQDGGQQDGGQQGENAKKPMQRWLPFIMSTYLSTPINDQNIPVGTGGAGVYKLPLPGTRVLVAFVDNDCNDGVILGYVKDSATRSAFEGLNDEGVDENKTIYSSKEDSTGNAIGSKILASRNMEFDLGESSEDEEADVLSLKVGSKDGEERLEAVKLDFTAPKDDDEAKNLMSVCVQGFKNIYFNSEKDIVFGKKK